MRDEIMNLNTTEIMIINGLLEVAREAENDKIKVTKKGKIKTTKIGYFFDCKKIVWYTTSL